MGDQEIIEDLKKQLASQARLFEERLSAIEASRENTVGLQAAPTGGDQPSSGVEGAGTSEQAGFASSRRFGVATDSLPQTIGDVDISGVAVYPLDLGRPVASNRAFPNSTVVVWNTLYGSDVLKAMQSLAVACKPLRL